MGIFGPSKKDKARAATAAVEAEKTRQLHELFDRAIAGDADDQDRVRHDWTDSSGYRRSGLDSQFQDKYDKVIELRNMRLKIIEFNKLLESLASASSLGQRVHTLLDLYWFLREEYWRFEDQPDILSMSLDDVREQLQTAVKEYYEELMAQRDQPEQFKKLYDLVVQSREKMAYSSSRPDSKTSVVNVGLDALDFAPDHNDLVALLYGTPPLSMFVNLRDMGPGEVRLLADQAIEAGDLTQAQIALAYCNQNVHCLQAVGDVLTAGLAGVVNSQRPAILTTTVV